MNGHPFESDMFDMELPPAVKQIIPGTQPVTSYSIGAGTGTTTSSHSTSHPGDDIDFYEFFNGSSEKVTKSPHEHARNQVLGMLEVEPLHFTCHSTSDGTKMERMDSVGNLGSSSLANPFGTGSSSMGNPFGSGPSMVTGGGSINFPSMIETAPAPGVFMPHVASSNLLPAAMPSKHLQDQKNYQSVKHKIMHIKQMLHEVNKNIQPPAPSAPGGSAELMPSTPKTTPQVMTPPLTPPNEALQQVHPNIITTDLS